MDNYQDKNICHPATYSGLYEKHAAKLSHLFYYKFGGINNPEDKVQEAFIKLWENCANVPLEKAWSYLYSVINNAMLNEHKHQKVVLKYQEVSSRDYSNETPEFVMRKKEFMNQYEQALTLMPEDFRVAFMLNKVDGKTHKEIAEMLGITKKVAEYRIYSGLKHLQKYLGNIKM